jgi:hypothetical protein
MKRYWLKVTTVIMCIVLSYASIGQIIPSTDSRPIQTSTHQHESSLEADLGSGDVSRQRKAIATIQMFVKSDATGGLQELQARWLPEMLRAGLENDVVEMSLVAIKADPAHTQKVQTFQEYRVRALMQLGETQEALSNAKSLWNVSTMAKTPDAALLVYQCLDSNKFRDEQLAGAKNNVGPVHHTILGSVKPAFKPFEHGKLADGDYRYWIGEGNLLLLADRPVEAKVAFERAYDLAPPSQLANVTENIARAMKAEDGTIGRANAWILSLRPVIK